MGIAAAVTIRAAVWLAPIAATTVGPAAAQGLDIDLPAGTLGAAAEVLARRGSVNIVLADAALLDRRVPAIRGRMTIAAAVARLAAASGAEAKRIGAAGWRLTLRPAPRRRAVPVVAPRRRRDATPPEGDIVVQASKRDTLAWRMAGNTQVIATPPIGIEAGTAALVTRSTLISSTYRGAGREKLFVRGVSDSSISGRLQPVTGLYFGDVRLTNSDSDPDLQLYDIASIEVLQGPQGTLYGAGSLAGIIRFNPETPARGSASGTAGGGVSVIAGGGTGVDADAVVNLPLGPDVAIRAVGYARSEAGFIDKPAIGQDVNRTRIGGGRVTARWWPAAGWTIDAIAMAQTIRARDTQSATPGAGPLENLSTVAEPYGANYAAGHLVVRGRLGDLSLTSATGVARQRARETSGPDIFFLTEIARRHDMTTHETRLSRTTGPDSGWVMGVALNASHSRAPLAFPDQVIAASVSEQAVFGEGSVRLAPFLSIGAGARAVWLNTDAVIDYATYDVFERRRIANTFRERIRERWLLPTASMLLRPADDVSVYLRYQESGRPGLSKAKILFTTLVRKPERIDTVEGGVRWQIAPGRRITASVQRSHWQGMQAETFFPFVGVFYVSFDKVTIESASLALDWTTLSGIQFDAAVTLNRNAVSDADLSYVRTKLPDVAGVIARAGMRWSGSVGRDAMLRVDAWARYEGISPATIYLLDLGDQGDILRTGLNVDLTRGAEMLTLGIDNLLDSRGIRYRLGSFVSGGQDTPLRPRTVRIGYRRTF